MTDRIAFAGTVTTEGRRIKGSVQLAGQRTFRNGEWVQVDPAALVKADASKAFASMEHDDAKLLGIATNGTLTITRTDQGFDYETAELPNTSYANDALELVRGKYVGGSSFEIDGLRSSFSTDPDGTRVRTYTGIKTFLSVSPVRDPAFPSIAAAFKKEHSVSDKETNPPEDPTPEPPKPPEPEPAKFSEKPKSSKDGWAKFAASITTEQVETTLENLMASTKGNLRGDELDRYEAFADELQRRKSEDAAAHARIEQVKFRHDAILGRLKKAPEAGLYESDDYKAAFAAYLRTGDKSNMEQFAQSIAGDGTQGGYMVPDGFLNRIVESQKAYGGIAGVAETITTSDGRSLRFPTNDDTGNSAVIVAEGAEAASGADKVLGSVDLGAYTYDATGKDHKPLLVSKELLQDAAFDIEAFIGRNLGTRIGRKQATDFATGSGSSEPKGLLDKTPDTMTATKMFAATIEHLFQVDSAYRDAGNCRWVLSDATLAKAYASVDGNGRPLFIPTADASAAGRPGGFIQGFPVTLDQSAGDLVAFGDIRQGYIIRYVRGVQLDVDPYTNISTRQVAYHAWARADANITDSASYSVSDYSGVTADS